MKTQVLFTLFSVALNIGMPHKYKLKIQYLVFN